MPDIASLQRELHQHTTDDIKRFAEITETLKRLEGKVDALNEIVKPMANLWSSSITMGSLIKNVGSVILAIGFIGVGIMWAINHSITKP